MVLVGPSGCGKTTLLRMIAGLEQVSSGTRRPRRRGRHRPLAARAGHRDGLPELRPLSAHDRRREPRLRAEAAEGDRSESARSACCRSRRRSASTSSSTASPAELSGGQRQRVAMGRAMVREPKAFLMDEPLSNLDAKLRVTMRGELARLHERLGVTTIYVTHDQIEAMTLGQRVAVLRDGVLQQVDTPQELFRHPANLFVAAFIGSPVDEPRRGGRRRRRRPLRRPRAAAAGRRRPAGRPGDRRHSPDGLRARRRGRSGVAAADRSGSRSSRTSAPSCI